MEKTTAFGLPFFYRVVLPGGLAAVLSLPLLVRVVPRVGVAQGDITAAIIIFAFFAGFVLEAAEDVVYKVYEGLRGWPPKLRTWQTRRWQSHIDRLLAETKNADAVTLGAIWADLGGYPLTDEGKPYAARPTRLGNILAAYESYPYHHYGMNAMVFWPRLWATLPKDVREGIERDWASADALIHAAGACVLVGLAYITTGAISLLAVALGEGVIFESNEVRLAALVVGVALVLLSYIPYYLSLAPQQTNGSIFRSTFDVYRGNLAVLSAADPAEWTRWDALGDELLYGPTPKVKAATPEAAPESTGPQHT